MKKNILLLLFLFISIKIHAVLPPLYHSLNEIQGIISDERLAKELGSAQGIIEIKKVEKGYLITSYKYQLKVDVIYIPQEIIGSSKFELKFHKKKPRKFLETDQKRELFYNER